MGSFPEAEVKAKAENDLRKATNRHQREEAEQEKAEKAVVRASKAAAKAAAKTAAKTKAVKGPAQAITEAPVTTGQVPPEHTQPSQKLKQVDEAATTSGCK